MMSDLPQNELTRLSDALAAQTASAQQHVAALRAPGIRSLTATVWRPGVAVASEQVFPKASEAELILSGGRKLAARVAGRDAGTNIVALRYEPENEPQPPPAAEPKLGA